MHTATIACGYGLSHGREVDGRLSREEHETIGAGLERAQAGDQFVFRAIDLTLTVVELVPSARSV